MTNSTLGELQYDEYKLATGDYYYSRDIAFYKQSGAITVYDFGIFMKQNCTLDQFTTIGFIPSGYSPGATIHFPVYSFGKYIGLMELTTSGNINLWPITDTGGRDLHFSATYCNY